MKKRSPSSDAKTPMVDAPSSPRSTPSRRPANFPGGLEIVGAEPTPKPGPYELIKLLGRGSLGPVYLGRDTVRARPVAVKIVRGAPSELGQRFLLEARPMLAWNHEHIARAHAAEGGWEGGPVLVTEHLVGRPLSHFIREGKVFSAPRAVELMVAVVKALVFAHGQGVVHRNLKPDNVFVCDDGVVKVLDFGLARVFQNDERAPSTVARTGPRLAVDDSVDELTQRAAATATLASLAPEQWSPGAAIDHRADLWAVGVMLCQLLTGRHPLDGQRLDTVPVIDSPMPKMSERPDGLPLELAAIIDGCLAKRREHRWADASTLLRALEPFAPARPKARPAQRPYVGLTAFREEDAALFFGRSAEITSALCRVRERPALAVVGPSGVGKSSFVRAGLVPALKRSGEPWEAITLRPGRDPLGALASVVGPLLTSTVTEVDPVSESSKLARRLAVEPGFAGVVLRARARKDGVNLLCIVDQLEELYTLVTDGAERRAFVSALLGLADDPAAPVRLAITLRSDFLDRCAQTPQLMARLSEGLFFLGPPTPEALREAITAPVELAGSHFESTVMVDEMLANLSNTRGALGLLQFSCARLWDTRDPGGQTLTRQGAQALGGVLGALGRHADAVLARLPPPTEPLVRAIFLRLVTAERTRALVTVSELQALAPDGGELTAILDELVQGGLLALRSGARVPEVELVHESLLYTWPTLARWLEESAEDASIVEQLRVAAGAWEQANRADSALLTGADAERAQRFAARYRGPLSDVQHAFLVAVSVKRQRAHRRGKTSRVASLVFLALLAVGSLVGLGVLLQSRDDALAQARAAREAEGQARQRQEAAERRDRERAKDFAARADEAEKTRQELERALNESENQGQRGRGTFLPRQPPPRAAVVEPPGAKPPPLEKAPASARPAVESGSSVIDTLK